MNGEQNSGVVIIGIGEYHTGNVPMSSIGLGSCIGVILHDPDRKIGSFAHVMLPNSNGKLERPGKFADTAVKIMLEELRQKGSKKTSLIAKLAGGAAMFKNFSGNLNIGQRNAEVLKEILKQESIPIKSEDLGGEVGRTITYYPLNNGKLIVKRANGSTIEI